MRGNEERKEKVDEEEEEEERKGKGAKERGREGKGTSGRVGQPSKLVRQLQDLVVVSSESVIVSTLVKDLMTLCSIPLMSFVIN